MRKVWSFSIASIALGVAFGVGRVSLAQYLPPAGGYAYSFEANAGQDSPGTPPNYDALDGTFGYVNNSSTWDGTGLGAGPPGGVSVIEGKYLRLQDTGDPRDYAFPDPSSRKIYLAHKLSLEGFAATFLDDGATLHFRIRLATTLPLDDQHPDGGSGIVPWPAGGDGYFVHDGGKDMISIHQASGGLISFALALPSDHAEITSPGLITNHLNGTAVSADVDVGDPGTPNSIPLDPTAWHEFWVTIEAGGAGTHIVNVYMDGSATPTTLQVTAGNGDDIGDSYLAFGVGATAQSGAFDVDFCRVIPEVVAPAAASAAPLLSGWTWVLLAMGMVGVGLLCLRQRRTVLPA
jgi:hypothetical protein